MAFAALRALRRVAVHRGGAQFTWIRQATTCPYHVLGVSRTADQSEITSAWRRQAMAHHPDTNPADPEASTRFLRIQEAYEALLSPAGRQTRPTPAAPDEEAARDADMWRDETDERVWAAHERRRAEAVSLYHGEPAISATLRGCRMVAKAIRGPWVGTLDGYNSLTLHQLQQALEAHLGPPRCAMGRRAAQQVEFEARQLRQQAISRFHADVAAAHTRAHLLDIAKGIGVRGRTRMTTTKLQKAVEAVLGFPLWSRGQEWRSHDRHDRNAQRVQALRSYHNDPAACRTLPGCRRIARGLGLRRTKGFSLAALQDALRAHVGLAPQWQVK